MASSWKAGLSAAFGGLVIPVALCTWLVLSAGVHPVCAGLFGLACGVAALSAHSEVLLRLKLLDTHLASVMTTAAVFTTVAAILLFAVLSGAAQQPFTTVGAVGVAAVKGIVFAGALFLLFLLLRRISRGKGERLQKISPAPGLTAVLAGALGFALIAEFLGLPGFLGTFFAGLILRNTNVGAYFSRDVHQLVRGASLGFFAPVFFVVAAFPVSLDVVALDLGFILAAIALASIGRIGGTAAAYRATGYGWREGLAIGAGTNGRDSVLVVLGYTALTLGLITAALYSVLVFVAVATMASVPVLLKAAVERLRIREEPEPAPVAREGALLVGAGATARALGRILARSQPVWIVDRNREHCAFADADGLNAIHGSALDEEVLREANASSVRYLLALTPNAEVNALVAERARRTFRIPEVSVANVGDESGHDALISHLQIGSAFGGPAPLPEWDYRVDHERVERIAFTLERELTPTELYQKLQQHQKSLPLAVRRGETYQPFSSRLTLERGDRIILYQYSDIRVESFDRFDRLAADCPVMDLDQRLSMQEFLRLCATWLAPRLSLDEHELTERLASRESAASTVLLPGLAIPHAIVDGENIFEMLIARCRNGVEIPDQDERVHALFVLVGSQDERTFHLRAISAIAQLVQQTDFDREWMLAPNAEALRKLVLHGPRRRVFGIS